LPQRLHRIKRLSARHEAGARRLGEDIGRAQALQGSPRGIIAAVDPAALPPLEVQLQGRLENVDVQAQGAVQLGALVVGQLALATVVADDLPHDGAVRGLHVALVVRALGAPPGDGDLRPLTVR